MQRISYEKLFKTCETILKNRGFDDESAKQAASVFADNSLDGIYSHGVNRFPRIISYIDAGEFNPKSICTLEKSFGAIERWNGNRGFGPLNARRAMDRAIELAKEHGIGAVALANNNHWLRGGYYGWQAAKSGFMSICWSNTQPNMPAWGGIDKKIGNNPLVLSIPRENGAHFVADLAMSQFSYGKLEEYKLNNEQLPIYGGYDTEGKLTTDPAEIEKSFRVLPMGYWKGSGLSVALDLICTVLSNGNSTSDITKFEEEIGLTQMFIVIDPSKFNTPEQTNEIVCNIIDDLHSSIPAVEGVPVKYPGQREFKTRSENLSKGIPVNDEKWAEILSLLK